MKLRPFIVLLLFVVSAGALAWVYYAATRAPRPPKESPWAGTIADLNDCGRRKHVKAAQYRHFARIAEKENSRQAGVLFEALARSEELQEENCARAADRLGGDYAAPEKVILFHGPTDGNMRRSLVHERRMIDEFHAPAIARAMQRGNRYAARILVWAAAADMRHVALLEQRCAAANPDSCRCGYLVCPRCGNVYDLDHCDCCCPFCMTDGKRFILFE